MMSIINYSRFRAIVLVAKANYIDLISGPFQTTFNSKDHHLPPTFPRVSSDSIFLPPFQYIYRISEHTSCL